MTEITTRAAALTPSTVNDGERSVEMIVSAGATVRRYDYRAGEQYDEVLIVSPESVVLDRMNSGAAPILDTHASWSMGDALGTVVAGTARIERGQLIATAKFGEGERIDPIWQNVKAGTFRNVSVGYRILAFEVDETTNPKTRRITRWEPMEVSVVPVGADPAAGFRSFTYGSSLMTTTTPAAPVTASTEVDATRKAEADRIGHIRSRAAMPNLALPDDLVQRAITSGMSVADFNNAVVDFIAERQERTQPHIIPHVRVIQDEGDTRIRAATGALLHRINPGKHKGDGPASEYRNISLMSLAEDTLRAHGVNPRSLRRTDIAARALSTSDFQHILADVSRATLRDAYEEVGRTWLPLSKPMMAIDFKEMKEIRLAGGGVLPKVSEHGEYKYGKLYESAETIKVETYGEIIAVTRQTIVNDRLDALATLPTIFGRRAAETENSIMWGLVLSNPLMGDGKALFHADHANLAGSGTALSVAGLSTGRAAMRKQTDIDGATPINVQPAFLVVPAALETTAEQLLASRTVVTTRTDILPDSMRTLTPIAEPRLDAASETAWYLFAAPNSAAGCLRHAFLEGEEGVYIEEQTDFDVDGMKMKARHDFGGAAMDFRGVYKDPGAAS